MNAPFGLPGRGPIPRFEAVEAQGFLPRGWIDGLTLSNDTTDATNDIAIAPGVARSTCRIIDGTPSTLARDQMDLELPVSIIKQIDVAFAPENYDGGIYPPQGSGDRSGGRSSSSLSNTTWHALLVGGGGLPTDVLFHDSATQSSILDEMVKAGGYTAYRRIGSPLRESAAMVGFIQRGDLFLRTTAVKVGDATIQPAVSTITVQVPTGIRVEALLNGDWDTTSGITLRLFPTDLTDQSVTANSGPLTTVGNASSLTHIAFNTRVLTDTSAQIRGKCSNSSGTAHIWTDGWVDTRDRNA